ncbi:MAG: GNVR domain-containing protein [Armatimonadota bacterium]|nr:hypothetical protein [bacterium]
MEARVNHTDDEVYLQDILAPLFAQWKLLLVVMLIGSIAGFCVSKCLKKTYESTATIFVQQSGGLSSLMKSMPIAGASGSGDSNSYLVTLLKSNTMARNTITRLDLCKQPDFSEGKPLDMEKAVRQFKGTVRVKDGKSGNIDISVKAHNPYLAARIANTMLDGLGSLVVTASKRKADFIDDRLKETTQDLDNAEERLMRFCEKNDATAIDDVTKTMIGQLSSLDAQLLQIDADLEGIRSQQENAGELESLVEGEVHRKSLESSRDFVVKKREELRNKLEHVPSVAAKYARLQRKVAVLSKTFELLTEQYQLARITQKGEDGDYQIVDRAVPQLKKVSPRGSMNTALGGILGLFIAVVVVSIRAGRNSRSTTRRALSYAHQVSPDTAEPARRG